MNAEKLIVIEGGTFNEVRKSLKQWLKLHSKDFSVELTFELYRVNPIKHVIKLFGNILEERFFNLVKYLDSTVSEKYEVLVNGYTTSVYPKIELQANPILFKIVGGKFVQIMNNGALKAVYKRFKIISFIALGLFIVGFFMPFFNKAIFVDYTFFLAMGIGLYYILDYEMLRVNRLYVYCLFIALFFYGFCYFINDYFIFNGDVHSYSFSPLILILFQKPLRLFFIFLFKREPSTEKPIPSFWDLIYAGLLFWVLFFLPSMIKNYSYL